MVATVAELCFAAQWAWLLREASHATESRAGKITASLILPLIAVAEKMPKEDFAVAPMPLGPHGKSFPTIGYAGWSMFAASQHKEEAWKLIACPVLLIHGLQSDALHLSTIQKMKRVRSLAVMHVPDTGHTPVLSDRNQCWFIHEWLRGRFGNCSWSVLHAAVRREDTSVVGDET